MKTTQGFGKLYRQRLMDKMMKDLKTASSIFVTRFDHVPVPQMEKLRTRLRQQGVSFFVVKNSLCRRTLDSLNLSDLAKSLEGTSAVSVTSKDPVASCKVFADFARENESFKVSAALVDGSVIDWKQIETLSKLPSRRELLTQLAMGLNAPVRGLVNVLSGSLRQLVTALNEITKKKGSS